MQSEIEDKKARTQIGDHVRVKKWLEDQDGTYRNIEIEAKVLAKSRYVVVTDRGTFQWKELLLKNEKRQRKRRVKAEEQIIT